MINLRVNSESRLNTVLSLAGLALPAVGIYLLIQHEQTLKNKQDVPKATKDLYLALGIALIVAGLGPIVSLLGRLSNIVFARRA